MNFPKTVIDLEALLYALAQQPEPLPEALQRSLQETGQALRQNHPDAAHQLRELIKQHAPLEDAYTTILEQWDEQYASQHRTKSLGATFQSTSSLDWLFVHTVTPTSDWIAAAKQLSRQQIQTTTTSFWDQADRVVVVIAGGAALGCAIAQIPGALVGTALAAAYGWYISSAQVKSVRNS